MDGTAPSAAPDTDLAHRVTVERDFEEVVGAILMDSLGPYSVETTDAATTTLVFYPKNSSALSDEEVFALLGPELGKASSARIERRAVPRDWVDGWKDHFHPVVVGAVRVRPPWEPALEDRAGRRTSRDGTPLWEVVIDPGLGFGTGLHPTTRGTLQLLQEGVRAGMHEEEEVRASRGRLSDVGTGSGILAIAAARMGWEPVVAFDIDPAAVAAARDNVAANGVAHLVEVWEAGVEDVGKEWLEGGTVLANMTLEPVLLLLRIGRPRRLVVSGILGGAQESRLFFEAQRHGFAPGRRLEEAGWISMELFSADPRSKERM